MNTSRNALVLAITMVCVILPSCESSDPGVEAELVQLKSERAKLKQEVEQLEGDLESKSSEISKLREEVANANKGDGFDKTESMNQFIAKVTELKASISSQYPGAKLEDAVQLPSFDAPLQGEVQIRVTSAGKPAKIHSWIGRGKLNGEWTFQQGQVATVSNPVRPNPNLASNGTSTRPKENPVKPKPPVTKPPKQTNPSPPKKPSDIPAGSRKVREDANGAVWLTPDGRYIIKLKN